MMHPLIAHTAAIFAKSGGITLDPIAKPIAAVLAVFYSLVPNYGVAIILLTIAVMIILTPLTIKQTRSMLVMQKLQPEMKRLQEEHKNDRQALNEAVMALYKEHNASPLGGCLPMLLPFPVFFALFRVLEGLSRMVKPLDPTIKHKVPWPKYLNPSTQMWKDIAHQGGTLKSFGMDLSKSALSVKGSFWASLPFFILLLLMIGTQYYQQRQLTSRNPQAAQGQQAQIMKFFPLMFGVISIRFPAGVVVYWTVSNIIRIFQQWGMYRYDPKVKALVEADVKEVEERTRQIERKPAAGRPRFRDLLSGASNTGSTDAKAIKPGTGKSGGAKPPVRPGQRGAKTPPGASGAKTQPGASGAKTPPGAKAPPGKTAPGAKAPLKGRAAPVGKAPPPAKGAPVGKAPPPAKGKPVTARAKPVPPAPAKVGSSTDRPGPNGSDANGRTGDVGSDGSAAMDRPPTNGIGADDVVPGIGADDVAPGTGTDDVVPGTAPPGSVGAKNGTPASRTGAGGARTGGTRGKRNRRGR